MKKKSLAAYYTIQMREPVRIKLIGTKSQINKAFYFIMINGNTYSDELYVFYIDRAMMLALKERGHKYKQLPIR